DSSQTSLCIDTANGQWRAAWTPGFLRFDPARFGLLNPPGADGKFVFSQSPGEAWMGGEFEWVGFTTRDDEVTLEYRVGEMEVREAPWSFADGDKLLLTRELVLGPALTPVSLRLM